MKCFYCWLLLLCTYAGKAQQPLYPLSVGEKMPMVKINQVINHSATSINVSALKGKLILIDFMYTTCGSCLRSLAAMDSLQQQFAGKMQVLAVSPQSLSTLTQFLKKSAIGRQLNIPFVATDTLLTKLFPHEFVSHVAWIGADGTVKAITGADYVNAENIRKILDGQTVNWPVKKDEPAFDHTQPLLVAAPQLMEMSAMPLASSALLGYVPGVRPYVAVTTDTGTNLVRYRYFNITLPQMLKTISRKWELTNSRIILSSADSNRYEFDPRRMYRREWNEANLFCYESFIPADFSQEKMAEIVIRDIATRFNVTVSFVTRPVETFVLRRSAHTVTPLPKYEQSVTLWDAVEALNSHYTRRPVIDSVGDIQNIFLPVNKEHLADLPFLMNAITAAGFQLRPEQREMEMLMIKPFF